ncbi:hypothetical protein [Helicobacter sp. MIT 14-3879]|uniref:hypothetical protein n=1 Tax=Helicobacter sp. MIT 14-3879 TaxID=2040649 RepID=UPI000E1EFE0E|nr:hypothetical protein [Helicobacter sp. MIT 14-3879]RDU60606.1 hypothetical protein CQA44_10365 [Helicobacter sp. MIT 14-3879]
MKHKDIIEVQSKFISPKHIGYSANIHLEKLNLQEDAQYYLQNVTKMQVVDLQLALQICRLNNTQEESNLEIFTLDKTDNIILEQNEKEIQKNSSYKISTQTSNDAKEVLDLSMIMINLISLLSDESKGAEEIEKKLNQIKSNLNSYKKDNMIFSDIKDYNFSNTQEAFTKAKEALDEICKSLDKDAKEAQKDFENRFNKDMINLTAQIIGTTYLPALAHILIHKFGTSMAKRFLKVFLPVSGPFGITFSLIYLLWEIYDFFSTKHKNNQKIEAAYRVYGAILSIYERLDYPLVSLLNFGHIGAGNLITTQKDNLFIYYLYPNDVKFNSTFLYPFLKNNVSNFEDISYKVTLSLNSEKEPNQAYIENIFEKNNKDDDSIYINVKKNTQFSTFSFEHLYKIYKKDKENNLLHSSAFQHLQSMFLKFDSFLFVKSSSFSSILANDMLLQSFTPSKQQNKPRMNKTALFLTNCLHNGLPEYQTQQHIKDKIFDNGNTKKNVLFLSAMYRVKKAIFVRTLIDNLTDLFKKLENYAYHNQTQQTHYLTQNLGKLIKEYNAGEVKYQGNSILSYSLNDKKLCAMNEKDFCNFVYDLCQIFITKKHAKMLDEYMNNSLLRLYWYGNDQQALSKAKADIQKIFQEMIAIILDVSKLFSHFNAYEVARFKDYQKELEVEYNKQREILERFFKTETFTNEIDKQTTPNNIFYQAKETEKLCIALLDKYFNKKINANEEDLESLLQNAQDKIKKEQSKAEEELQTSNQNAYYQITIEYVIPLLPLNRSFLNCLEERERFLFCRLIICEINATSKPHQSARSVIDNLLACYEFIISFCALSNLNDKEFERLLLCDAKEGVFKAIYEISIDSGQKILKDELKDRLKKIDKYGIVSAMIFEDSTKEKIKDITSNIAEELDKKHFNLHSVDLPKGLSWLPVIANSTISYMCNIILDEIFPVQIGSVKDMKQQAIALTFALNRHTNTPYATCKQGSEYLTFPIEITQTLINADLKALIIGGSALNSGLFVHTPSIALFNQDSQNSLKSLKETLRHFMNNKVNLIGIGERGKSVVKEAYAKLWFYLDMGENQELESYLREELQTKPSYYTLENLTSDKFIRVKLKKAKELDNSDENFIEVEGNAKGGIKFNHDFLIQLKRVAEYNYGMYRGLISVEENSQNDNETTYDDGAEKADKSPDKYLCGNLIYNEDYIPTMIDIVD